MEEISCRFCGASSENTIDGRCSKCGTSFPSDAKKQPSITDVDKGVRRRPKEARENTKETKFGIDD